MRRLVHVVDAAEGELVALGKSSVQETKISIVKRQELSSILLSSLALIMILRPCPVQFVHLLLALISHSSTVGTLSNMNSSVTHNHDDEQRQVLKYAHGFLVPDTDEYRRNTALTLSSSTILMSRHRYA